MKALITVRYETSTDLSILCSYFCRSVTPETGADFFLHSHFIPLISLSMSYISTFPHEFLMLDTAFSFQALRIKMLMKHIIFMLDIRRHLDSDYQAGH